MLSGLGLARPLAAAVLFWDDASDGRFAFATHANALKWRERACWLDAPAFTCEGVACHRVCGLCKAGQGRGSSEKRVARTCFYECGRRRNGHARSGRCRRLKARERLSGRLWRLLLLALIGGQTLCCCLLLLLLLHGGVAGAVVQPGHRAADGHGGGGGGGWDRTHARTHASSQVQVRGQVQVQV